MGLPRHTPRARERRVWARKLAEATWKRQQGKGQGCRNALGSFEDGLGSLWHWWAERQRLKDENTAGKQQPFLWEGDLPGSSASAGLG